jgi:hypothetical protein
MSNKESHNPFKLLKEKNPTNNIIIEKSVNKKENLRQCFNLVSTNFFILIFFFVLKNIFFNIRYLKYFVNKNFFD